MPEHRLQRWHLVGLPRMHDALIRRLTKQECDLVAKDSLRKLSIGWSIAEDLDSWSGWSHPEGIDVLIASADTLMKLIENSSVSPQTLLFDAPSQGLENGRCLRLVWSGLNGAHNDLGWATEFLAQGVIADPASLQSWVRIAVLNAHGIPQPLHPFLRDLKLPTS
jgi:hypothetical protein